MGFDPWSEHGEPGASAMLDFSVTSNQLEKRLVVVHWDKRGTRRSYYETVNSSIVRCSRQNAL